MASINLSQILNTVVMRDRSLPQLLRLNTHCIILKIPSVKADRSLTSHTTDAITKTCLYIFDPLKPHFYIVYPGVYIIFLIFAQNIDCGYSLEPPRRGGSYEYLQSMF